MTAIWDFPPPINHLRPEHLDRTNLSYSSHTHREDGVCLTEVVAWLAGEPHTDEPKTMCPTLTKIMKYWNDELNIPYRDPAIKHYAPRLIGTNLGPKAAELRANMAAEWLFQQYFPGWLDLIGLSGHARTLGSFRPPRMPLLPDYIRHLTDVLQQATDQATEIPRAPWTPNLPTFDVVLRTGTQAIMDTVKGELLHHNRIPQLHLAAFRAARRHPYTQEFQQNALKSLRDLIDRLINLHP